jgi:mono/diheme cytochrome c family protein
MYRLFFTLLALYAAGSVGAAAQTSDANARKPDLKNGRYMYFAGGCGSCHAAPASAKCDEPASTDDLQPVGGRCLKTEFGTFHVPNITPDRETGIGGWSETDFIRAMKEGTSPDGYNYYPAFPYSSYQRMTRPDLVDLWAFLQTLDPISSTTADHELSFPYNIRKGLTVWKALYLDGESFTPDPAKSARLNRGAYLVEGPGHCGECHSPRNSLGGIIQSQAFAGAHNPEGKGKIPNITPSQDGLGDWSTDDITYLLETGNTPDFDVIGGVMAPVQENMAKLKPEDRSAIAAYLKSLPPLADAVPKKKKANGEEETEEEKEGDGSGSETSDGGSKQPDGAE